MCIIISNTDWLCSGGLFLLGSFMWFSQKVCPGCSPGLLAGTSPKSASPASLSVSFSYPPRGFSSVTDSGDILTWCLISKERVSKGGGPFLFLWLQKPCKVTSTTSTGQTITKTSGSRERSRLFCWCDILESSYTFQVQVKTHRHTQKHVYTQFSAFHYWVPWIFSMIQTCFLELLFVLLICMTYRCLNWNFIMWKWQ